MIRHVANFSKGAAQGLPAESMPMKNQDQYENGIEIVVRNGERSRKHQTSKNKSSKLLSHSYDLGRLHLP